MRQYPCQNESFYTERGQEKVTGSKVSCNERTHNRPNYYLRCKQFTLKAPSNIQKDRFNLN